jgi:hypothetical protein
VGNKPNNFGRLNPPSTETAGAVVTAAMLDRALDHMLDEEAHQRAREFQQQQQEQLARQIEARYARWLGVESLSEDQRRELWDGIADAYWRYMERTTNIREFFGLDD